MRFILQEKLGKGAMGTVYKALDTETGLIVAVKVLPFKHAAREELLIARKISHRHVCKVFDLHFEDGKLFISMEFLEGETLRSLLARLGRMDVDDALAIIRQVLEGLDEAHRLGILHRDLKPENIMLVPEGGATTAKLMDFGVAHFMDPDNMMAERLQGTPTHMATEQFAHGLLDVRTDIYSLGLILYEMISGHPAFEGTSTAELIRKQMLESPLPLDPALVLPPGLERAIFRCIEKEPARRFATVAELRSALTPSGGTAVAARAPYHPVRVVSTLLILTTLLVFAALSEKTAVPPAVIPTPTPSPVLPKTLDGQMQSIAIFPFKNMVGDPKYQSFETRMAEDLRGAFSRSGRFRVVERSRIDEVIGSLKSPEQVGPKELGRLVGAQYLAFGSFQVFQGELTIFTDIDITATGEGVFSDTLTGEAKDATALSTRFANDLIAKLKDLKK